MISNNLKNFRAKMKYSQQFVADYLEISQSQYSYYENGRSVLNANQIIKLCELYQCTPNDILGIHGAMSVAFDPLFEEYKELIKKIKK